LYMASVGIVWHKLRLLIQFGNKWQNRTSCGCFCFDNIAADKVLYKFVV
jgi:hypothetical protein